MTSPSAHIPRRSLLVASLALAAAIPAMGQTATFPNQPVKIVIPTAPGGNLDALARVMATKLTEAWGQQVLVESRPGANTTIATTAVAKAPADGHTLLFTISGFLQNLVLRSKVPYEMKDFAPVSLVASFPIALAANASLPANDFKGLLKLAKESPGKYTFGSYGMGSGAHLIGEGLNKAAGVEIKHVAYKGEAASFTDLVGGEIELAYGSVGFYANHIAGGKVKLLAMATPHRLPTFPDVPTFAELGYPDVNLPGWGAMFLPAGTPDAVVKKWVSEVQKIVAMPDVRKRILDFGYEPVANDNVEFGKFLQEDLQRWTKLARENNISLD